VVDDLDVVPVRVEHERTVVARVLDRALARFTTFGHVLERDRSRPEA
jgi:hypothetical protein